MPFKKLINICPHTFMQIPHWNKIVVFNSYKKNNYDKIKISQFCKLIINIFMGIFFYTTYLFVVYLLYYLLIFIYYVRYVFTIFTAILNIIVVFKLCTRCTAFVQKQLIFTYSKLIYIYTYSKNVWDCI